MIIDTFENAKNYKGLSIRLDKALGLIGTVDFASLDDGRYDVDGDDIFYMVQRYQTKPTEEGKFETHQKYIDIQLVVVGNEMMGYAAGDCLEVDTEYNAENDCEFYKLPGEFTKLIFSEKMFAVYFANEPHLPCRVVDKPENVIKVVIKLKA